MNRHDLADRIRSRLHLVAVGALTLVALLTAPASALGADEELREQMQRMQERMETMARELESLRAELAATQARLAERRSPADRGEPGAEPTAELTPGEPRPDLSVDHGHLEVTSADGDFEVGIGGRLQLDAAFFKEDEGPIGNGFQVRRGRLYVAGRFDRDWHYKNQVDFAGNEVSIKDAYIRYTGLPARLTLGHFKEPFSLEELMSARFITFMERALPNVFAPARNLGLAADLGGAIGDKGGWSASLGAFGEGIDDSRFDGDALREDDEGVAVTGRLTAAPIATADRLAHFGAATSYRDTGDNTTLRLRQRFESHIADRRLVNTGAIKGVDNLTRVGAEAAFAWGPLSLQGEYMHAALRRPGRPDPAFSGYYVYGSWFLTGESRASAYSTRSGKFGRLPPRSPLGRGPGGWELAARFSRLDLTDAGIAGGEEDNVTVALNWYPVYNVRIGAEYVHVLDLTGGPKDGDEPAAFQMRAQVDF
jgi:phosphate-selective porin OprO/OprP